MDYVILKGALRIPAPVGECAMMLADRAAGLSEDGQPFGVEFAYSDGCLTIHGEGSLDYFAAGGVLSAALAQAGDATVHELELAFCRDGRTTSLGILRVSQEGVRRETLGDFLTALLELPRLPGEEEWDHLPVRAL